MYIECLLCARKHAADIIVTLRLDKNDDTQPSILTHYGNMLLVTCSHSQNTL